MTTPINKTIVVKDVFNNEYQTNLADLTQTLRTYAVIIRDDKLLLTKQWDGYSLPGGGVDKGESLEQALERELKEETNLDVKAGTMFYDTFRLFQRNADSKPVQAFMFYFTAASVSGNISTQAITKSEKGYVTGNAEWVSLKTLDTITFRHSVDLNEILRHI